MISLSSEDWVHQTRLTPPPLIEVPVPSQERDRSFICVLGVPILPTFMILIFDFGLLVFVFHFIFSLFIAHVSLFSSCF